MVLRAAPPFSSTSPEFSTDGQYAKCLDTGEQRHLALQDRRRLWHGAAFGISGFPAGSLSLPGCSDLRPGVLSWCSDLQMPLFTSETFGLAKAAVLTKDRTISGFLKYFESIGSGDAFRRMCILDALILNTGPPQREFWCSLPKRYYAGSEDGSGV